MAAANRAQIAEIMIGASQGVYIYAVSLNQPNGQLINTSLCSSGWQIMVKRDFQTEIPYFRLSNGEMVGVLCGIEAFICSSILQKSGLRL